MKKHPLLENLSGQWTPEERLRVISHLSAHSDAVESETRRYGINSLIRKVATVNASALESMKPELTEAFQPEPEPAPEPPEPPDPQNN